MSISENYSVYLDILKVMVSLIISIQPIKAGRRSEGQAQGREESARAGWAISAAPSNKSW